MDSIWVKDTVYEKKKNQKISHRGVKDSEFNKLHLPENLKLQPTV